MIRDICVLTWGSLILLVYEAMEGLMGRNSELTFWFIWGVVILCRLIMVI